LPFVPLVAKAMVSVAGALGETVSCGLEKLHAAPVGRPLHVKLTVPVKPLVGATLRVSVVEELTATVATLVEVLKLKVGVAEVVAPLVIAPKRPWVSPLRPAVK
jgi:hypothetical protein